MISLFTPKLKVQKQRAVMRDADMRLAKYSSRGLFVTLVIFGICMLVGQYQQLRPQMTLILALGLIFFALLRGYFIFRFEALYARAPAKWRNIFFVTSLLSVSWWSFMVANVTLVVGIGSETPLLWLYTTVFLSSVVNAYGPYRPFFTWYLFIGLAPIALTAVLIGTPLSLLYGLILLVLFLMLHNQALDVSRNYWERLQANFDLQKRAYALEVEKMGNESSIANNSAFLKNFSHELKSALSTITSTLHLLKYADISREEKQLVTLAEQTGNRQVDTLNSVSELADITDKSLVLDINIVNASNHIEQVVETFALTAHQKGVEVYCIFSSPFPVCIRADSTRIKYMLGNLINSVYKYCSITELVTQSSCKLLKDNEAELRIEVIGDIDSAIPQQYQCIFETFNVSQSIDAIMQLDFDLAITKGIARCMDGNLGIDYQSSNNTVTFWFTVRVEIITNKTPDMTNIPKFNNKRILLYRPPLKIVDTLVDMLHNWGLEIEVIDNLEEGIAKINVAAESTNPFHLVIVYTSFGDSDALVFSAALNHRVDSKQLPQILIFSQQQSDLTEIQQYLEHNANVKPLFKPVKQSLLLQLIKQLLIEDQVTNLHNTEQDWLQGKSILLLHVQNIDRMVTEEMLKKLGCIVTSVSTLEEALTAITKTHFDGFIIESHIGIESHTGIESRIQDDDAKSVVDAIRKCYKDCCDKAVYGREKSDTLNDNMHYAPILGLSNQVVAGGEIHCLSAGMDGHIEKPLQLDNLQAVLGPWLGRRTNH